jgi:glycosyltransferase involved in cell wall biosynthesis
MSLRVSVVVPTCNRPALLARCLEALEHQHLARSDYEIIVVDDSSERRGPAAARNRGWRQASAPVVAFADDDTIPSRGWLRAGLAAMQSPGIVAVSGRVEVPLPEEPTDAQRNTAGLEIAEFVTANCFVRRDALETIGGFDERFPLPWREDSDLHFALIECFGPASVRPAPDAVVCHPPRPVPFASSLKDQRKVFYDALLFKKHRRLYRSRVRATPRWDYYTIAALLALGLVAVAQGRERLATVALAGWGLLTIWFCLRRLRGNSLAPVHVAEMILTSAAIPPLAVFWRMAGALRYRTAFF